MKAIIIGAGLVGYTIAQKFSSEGQEVVIIETDEKRIKEVQESLDVRIVHGSGSSPQVLSEAGIDRAEMVIAVTDSDEVNMIASLIAETQSRVPKKIARIRNPDYLNYPIIFEKNYLDLDLIINPEMAAAERIFKIIEIPGAVDVMDFLDGKLKLVGCRVSGQSAATGKKVKDLSTIFPTEKIIIVAIYRGTSTIIPHGSTIIEDGDLIYAVTVPDSAKKLLTLFGNEKETAGNRILLVGGGNVGYYLADRLEQSGYQAKIIEKNEKRCNFLAEKLDKTIVLCGDGTDRELLMEENIGDMDTFIAVTDDEEANILTSLLSKRLGVKRCISIIDKPEYLSMVSTIGIDVAVSPRLTSVSEILQFIRKGRILSVKALMEERVEAIETIAMETSDIVDTPLKDIKFPKGAIVGAIVRNEEVIIPGGTTTILPKDKVIIFAQDTTIAKVEKFLMVKPEFF